MGFPVSETQECKKAAQRQPLKDRIFKITESPLPASVRSPARQPAGRSLSLRTASWP